MYAGTLQNSSNNNTNYWNSNLRITPFRLPLPPVEFKPQYLDLNHDGKPDAIQSMTHKNVPIMWIDDDNDLKNGDLEGDTDNDCLLVDRNRDGVYGGQGDLVIDWVDSNFDGKADMQIVLEYPAIRTGEVWPNGHYMIVMDLDKDNIFNYIDWNSFEIRSWDKIGLCNFYSDYSGQTAFMKIHTSTYDMKDLRYNWENPFLFYDQDKDGYSEMAIRCVDTPRMKDDSQPANSYINRQVEGRCDWISYAIDMDNDNGPGNEFDFDFTIGYQGEGFDYKDQVHKFSNPVLSEADSFFLDPRFRHLQEMVYPDHKSVLNLIFNTGKWSRVNFVWDEDNDNKRWERVEFYEPLDPFKIGWKNGGIDNHKQSDPAGDRGEWDMDNSGKGTLYISRFDGRIHLLGAEWGAWRIDQNAGFFEGWDRMWMSKDPKNAATLKYTDTDMNGFFDQIEYDMDGDAKLETVVSLKAVGVDDICSTIDISKYKYNDYTKLMKKVSDDMWANAQLAIKVAEHYGLETSWYSKLKQAHSIQERYNQGYWLQYYLYKDLEHLFLYQASPTKVSTLQQAYFGAQWKLLLKYDHELYE
ncbi:MAG: hypothetical protein NTY32_10810 [Bacteroidia bacterium]|nr:hypothetical protein [Bacteroidia bacterium]